MSDVKLHLFTRDETIQWLAGGQLQRALAAKVANNYRANVGILSVTGYLIAYVEPNGSIQELSPPFKSYARHEISNKPTVEQCACRNFFDPEIEGPWSLRNSSEHHPICQFQKDALEVGLLNNRLAENGNLRDDTLRRAQEEIRGKRGEKTGARRG